MLKATEECNELFIGNIDLTIDFVSTLFPNNIAQDSFGNELIANFVSAFKWLLFNNINYSC